jgi:hypothetical protein
LRTVFQPLRGWLISDGRSATQFVLAAVLFFAVDAMAETTNGLSAAEIQGCKLARELCDGQPAESFSNAGILQIRDDRGQRYEVPIKCKTIVTSSVWQSFYEAKLTNGAVTLIVIHAAGKPNSYYYNTNSDERVPQLSDMPLLGRLFLGRQVSGEELIDPFANSDFWFADLGLEFFHWPQQKVLKKEVRRSCGCTVLESTNPNPTTNGYSRVVSWIDNDSLGIVEAYAYDVNGKKLKYFYPKNLEKVNGQYQVQSMFMENLQTGSRTRLEFDLKK